MNEERGVGLRTEWDESFEDSEAANSLHFRSARIPKVDAAANKRLRAKIGDIIGWGIDLVAFY